jgi:hypothetical protein
MAAQEYTCPQCGGLVQPGRQGCPNCGRGLSMAATQALEIIPRANGQQHSCPRCSSPIYVGQFFCNRCRLALDPASLAAFYGAFRPPPPYALSYPVQAYQPISRAAYAQYALPPPRVVLIQEPKSVGLALLLTFLFGPLGLLYSTVPGAIIMLIASVFILPLTFCLGAFIIWPICMIWAAVAASSANDALASYIPG